jgi:hypothetical protein
MNAAQLAAKIKAAAEEFPPGALVWHRADGVRGVVLMYQVDGDGCVMLRVGFGSDSQPANCYAYELSATPVGDGTDGEDWKGGKEGADA